MAAGSITEQCALLLPALSAAASGEGEGWRKVEAVDEALVQLRKVAIISGWCWLRTAWPHPPHLVSKGGRPASLSVKAARAAPRGGATESGIAGQYDGGRSWGRPGGGGGRGRSQAADAPRILAASD